MKPKLLVFFLSVCALSFAEVFEDSRSGLCFNVPEGFEFNEEESDLDFTSSAWCYTFYDHSQNVLTVEIEEYDYFKSLPEYFHHSLTAQEIREDDDIIFEGYEFENISIGDIEFTKSKLRILSSTDSFFEPICLYDYLFVQEQYGFTIGLVIRENKARSDFWTEQIMQNLLQSIFFK